MKRLALIALAAAALGVLWWKTGWAEIGATLRRLDGRWFAGALALFLPQVLISGVRWAWIVGTYQPLAVRRATEMVLASSALNVLFPSKMGDIAKGAFLRRDLPGGDPATGIALGVFEKGLDTAALGAVMLFASALAPPEDPLGWALFFCAAAGLAAFALLLSRPVAERIARAGARGGGGATARARALVGLAGRVLLDLRREPRRLLAILASAVLLWVLHLVQFSLALRAAGGSASAALIWSRVPMAIFLGLLPVTFAGMGTRDAAMAYFLGGAIGTGPALALGVFATLRYVLPALAGIPFVARLRAGGRAGARTSG